MGLRGDYGRWSPRISLDERRICQYVIDDKEIEQIRNKHERNISSITKEKTFRTSLLSLNLRTKCVCEEMEGSMVIEDCEKQDTLINMINWSNIEKHIIEKNAKGKSKRIYHYMCVGAIKVYITPLQDFGKKIHGKGFICDMRHLVTPPNFSLFLKNIF